MRRRLRHTMMVLLLLLLAVAGLRAWSRQRQAIDDLDELASPSATRARTVFELDADRWTTFHVPASARHLRIASRVRVDLPPLENLDPDLDYGYELEYRLSGLDGDLMTEGTLALQSRVTAWEDAEEQPVREAWLAGDTRLLANLRASIIDVDAPDVIVLQLRARSMQPPLESCVARVMYRQEIPERKQAYLWDRLSPRSRERLLAPRVLGAVDLTDTEKRRLLEHRWVPLGPQGIEARDYRQLSLLLRDDVHPVRRTLVEHQAVGERRCGPGQHLVLGLPASGGDVRLAFRFVEHPAPTVVRIHWYGENIHDRKTHQVSLAEGQQTVSLSLPAGMIECVTPVSLAVMPWLKLPGEPETLLESEASMVRAWTCDRAATLTFGVGTDQGGHVRLVCRPAEAAATGLQVQWMDAEGRVLQTQARILPVVPSVYDRLITPEGDAPVADPVALVCPIPDRAARLVVKTGAPVHINAYTRPAGLLHRTRVPEDYLRALPDPLRQPVWFAWQPEERDALRRSHRSVMLQLQVRPPEDDMDILAGRYQWEDFNPDHGALGHYLLSPRTPGSLVRQEAYASLFAPLPRAGAFDFTAPAGVQRPVRRLVYLRASETPATLELTVDGKPVWNQSLFSRQGEWTLPPLTAGRKMVQWSCSDPAVQVLVNYADPEAVAYLKRLAQKVGPGQSLDYTIEKNSAEAELLTGTWYTPAGATGEVTVAVFLSPLDGLAFPALANTFTPRAREYTLRPDASGESRVLGAALAHLDRGRRFFIPLGTDLPPGRYRLRLQHRGGEGGYLTLSRITGGNYADARFFREGSR